MIDSVEDYAILKLDPSGHIATWNTGAERIKGYSAAEIVGRHFSAFYTPEDQAAGKPGLMLHQAAEQGRCPDEGWRVRKDGSRFWASVLISAMRDDQGALIGFTKVTRDLTQRREADAALAEAHRRLRAIVDSSPFSIITTGIDGAIDCFNCAAERLTGYAQAEMRGRPLTAIHSREEIDRRASELSRELGTCVQPGLDALTALPRRGQNDEREWSYLRKDGTPAQVQLAMTAMRDPGDGAITGYMAVAFDLTEHKRFEDYSWHLAHYDRLTGLPLRPLLKERTTLQLSQARRTGTQLAVLLLNLDHFKRVNDSLGHHVGDELLRGVAGRLKLAVRTSDLVARLDGDEFAVVLNQVGSRADVERIAADILQRLSLPMVIGNHELHVTPSIGVALCADGSLQTGELLRNADTALLRAKQEGRRCWRLYQPEMERRSHNRLELENALRLAIEREQLQLHYQPQVSLENGEVVGMEALLRWNDPQRGSISPADFIPVAEESGLIVPLGEWVLRSACRDTVELQARTGLPLRVAVNLSSHQFRNGDIVATIEQALRESGLPAKHLEVEITEGVLMDRTDATIERMRAIRALGVEIAIDDFGTGFSSLSYVTRFPINTLKIDRSFVSKMTESAEDAAVAQAIIALAHSLDVRVVAEGVETAGQIEFLRDRCCDKAQGYLISRPVAPERFSAQGYHFSRPRAAAEFADCLVQLRRQSAAGSQGPVH